MGRGVCELQGLLVTFCNPLLSVICPTVFLCLHNIQVIPELQWVPPHLRHSVTVGDLCPVSGQHTGEAPLGQLLRHIRRDPETMTQTDKSSALHTWTNADSGKGTRTDAPIQSVGERDPVLSRAWGCSETQSRQVSGASFSGECDVSWTFPVLLPRSASLIYYPPVSFDFSPWDVLLA